jgi:hypothetical protein
LEEEMLPVVFQGKDTKFRARYVEPNGPARGWVGREEVDIRLEEKTISKRNN